MSNGLTAEQQYWKDKLDKIKADAASAVNNQETVPSSYASDTTPPPWGVLDTAMFGGEVTGGTLSLSAESFYVHTVILNPLNISRGDVSPHAPSIPIIPEKVDATVIAGATPGTPLGFDAYPVLRIGGILYVREDKINILQKEVGALEAGQAAGDQFPRVIKVAGHTYLRSDEIAP